MQTLYRVVQHGLSAHSPLSKDRASVLPSKNCISRKEVLHGGTSETSSATAWITEFSRLGSYLEEVSTTSRERVGRSASQTPDVTQPTRYREVVLPSSK